MKRRTPAQLAVLTAIAATVATAAEGALWSSGGNGYPAPVVIGEWVGWGAGPLVVGAFAAALLARAGHARVGLWLAGLAVAWFTYWQGAPLIMEAGAGLVGLPATVCGIALCASLRRQLGRKPVRVLFRERLIQRFWQLVDGPSTTDARCSDPGSPSERGLRATHNPNPLAPHHHITPHQPRPETERRDEPEESPPARPKLG